MSDDTAARVAEVISTDIRPALQMDGGDIELVSFEDGVVRVRLQGACKGCPGARMTLQMGVQARLQDKIPEVQAVEAVD